MNPIQTTLPILKPTTLAVAGRDLESKLAELRAQGAHVESMEMAGNGGWRLRLVWTGESKQNAVAGQPRALAVPSGS